jgi:2'-5' RNA ligase
VYSLNVPVPGRVQRIVSELHPQLVAFDSLRDHNTLLLKRIGDSDIDALVGRARRALRGAPTFEVAITGIDYWAEPTAGPGPVVYLAVESPGIRQLHQDLCETFDPEPLVEGDDYTPHVTLARGGSVDDAERLAQRDLDTVTWTATELNVWDARYKEVIQRVPLPA